MNDDNGKKLLIGGGLVALGAIILNQIYTSGFQAGLIAAGAEPERWARYGGGGFPFGLFVLIGIGVFIWFKVTNGGKRGPGGWFSGHRRGFFDDRRQARPQPYQQQPGGQQQQQYGAPQQPYSPQAPGTAPQPPVNFGAYGVPSQPPVPPSPPSSPVPGYPQPEPGQATAPPAAPDPNKPAI